MVVLDDPVPRGAKDVIVLSILSTCLSCIEANPLLNLGIDSHMRGPQHFTAGSAFTMVVVEETLLLPVRFVAY